MDRVVQQSCYTDTKSGNKNLESHLVMCEKDFTNIFDYVGKFPTPDVSPEVSSGSGAPSSTPKKIGNIYSDTTNHKVYIATGNSSSTDWRLLN